MRPIETRYCGEYTEFWVIFTQGTHWISKILRPHFSHIYLITRDKYNWILLNPTRLYLSAEILPFDIQDPVPHLLRTEQDSIIKITFGKRDTSRRFGNIGLLNCLTMAKYMLGINTISVTPWQFYRRLLRFKAKDRARYGIQSIIRV
jgi:hypothetical protein